MIPLGVVNQQANLSYVKQGLVFGVDAADLVSYPGSGATVYDLSPNGYDGTLGTGATVDGDPAYFNFDGLQGQINFGTIPLNDPLQLHSSVVQDGCSLMFALWYDGTGDDYQRVIDKSNGSNASNGWSVYSYTTSTPQSGLLTFQENTNDFRGINPSALTWQIWTVTHNKTTNAWQWFLNGVLVDSGTMTYSIPNVATELSIGTWNHSTARELKGRIGFMYIYDHVLSQTEINQNINYQSARFGI